MNATLAAYGHAGCLAQLEESREALRALAAAGHQVLDLEGLAEHRGSAFGARGAQPSMAMYSSFCGRTVWTMWSM